MHSADVLNEICKSKKIGYLLIDKNHRYLACNETFAMFLQVHNIAAEVNEIIQPMFSAQIQRLLLLGGELNFKKKLLVGELPAWIHFSLMIIPKGVLILAEDISEEKYVEESLRKLAGSDPLTGLANRARFSEQLMLFISAAKEATLHFL